MIGQLTEASMHAAELALTYEQLAWPQDTDEYDLLRGETERILAALGIEDVELPATHAELSERRETITAAILGHLAEERGRILGDTVALPTFFLVSFSLRAALNLALRSPDTGEREILEDCLEDLGLDRELATELDREAGWITLFEGSTDEETHVRRSDVIKASGSFFVDVLTEFGRKEETGGGLDAVFGQLKELQASVESFHAEQREANERVETLIQEGNAEIKGLLGELKAALVATGVDPATAEEVTTQEPGQLWDRVVRWLGGAGPRDAAEAAFWVALDFVPGGTGVKLGIKIAEAVRKSLKAHGK